MRLARKAVLRGAAALAVALAVQPAVGEELTLVGAITGPDHQTYRELAFDVPPGVRRLTVAFEYDGKAERSVIDLGLRDPRGFRGWSGGSKAGFVVSETDATPGYLPGPLPAGRWALLLGVPNIRSGVRAGYTAKINLERDERFSGFATQPLKGGPGWYRGDLHLHTGHSDAFCPAQSGVRAPCPTFRTLEAARARGLDFVAVTDHNTTSQAQDLRALSAAYDQLLVIPGREVTTFFGHANVFGPTAEIDFQLGSSRAPGLDPILDQVERAGGLFSINHPGLPSGEACMGCGWSVPDTDYRRVQAIEVLNGGVLSQFKGDDRPLSGVPFWESRLNEGLRITAIGGSDNHDATLASDQPSAVGYPTTVVRARELSQAAILDGLRAGHVFIDAAGSGSRWMDMQASSDGRTAEMGDTLLVKPGHRVRLDVRLRGVAGGTLSLAGSTPVVLPTECRTVASDDTACTLELTLPPGRRWLRAEVRGPDGRLWLFGNPVYLAGDNAGAGRGR
ncbi:CehA/McbA family metallohydrolase [Phenylobacterium deserti]|uniref:PHP domain-containing protein n=1 Tax=Phenylobacterium deserti TaxID=1914756 RepID=A0A328ADA1_9CAUL|nr:CehA/McbA family metallohydrolase [Phenylobacterium deserti]RAK52196.1 PHP domain-containing protein [Phenylobacterium deserti]